MTISRSGGGVTGDMIGFSVDMAAASVVAPQLGNMLNGATPSAPEAPTAPLAKCAKCGADIPANAKFCPECGEKI